MKNILKKLSLIAVVMFSKINVFAAESKSVKIDEKGTLLVLCGVVLIVLLIILFSRRNLEGKVVSEKKLEVKKEVVPEKLEEKKTSSSDAKKKVTKTTTKKTTKTTKKTSSKK